MKNTILALLLILLLSACKKEIKCDAVFSSVDVSFSNTWALKMSVHIDSSKIAHVLMDSLYKGKTYYTGTINKSAFCAINSLVSSALTNNYSDVIGQQAPDGEVSGIEILTKGKKIQALLLSQHPNNILDTIMTQMTILSNFKLTKETNSNFKFSSYEIITPKIEDVKFIQPLVKQAVIEE